MRTHLIVAVSLLLAACGQATPGEDRGEAGPRHVFEDPDVTRIWNDMMDVIAPDRGWERARYIEFDWVVGREGQSPSVRRHRWDRWDGIARVESVTGDGARQVAIFPTASPESGRVWMDGVEVQGDDAANRLQGAYRSHINDSYWLLMPFKWNDEGVTARYLGEQTDDEGRRWEVVELYFDEGVGLTPQNRYHAFVNPDTRRMERWNFFRSAESESADIDTGWAEWRSVGPIQLSPSRPGSTIGFDNLRVETEVPTGAFDPLTPG
jgi:hypothetical protein